MPKPKPDMTDDWWDKPDRMAAYQQEPAAPDKTEFLIERAEKRDTFGTPGYIKNWRFWAKFDTPKERDAELTRLREKHPAWRLRARDRNRFFERMGIFPE